MKKIELDIYYAYHPDSRIPQKVSVPSGSPRPADTTNSKFLSQVEFDTVSKIAFAVELAKQGYEYSPFYGSWLTPRVEE